MASYHRKLPLLMLIVGCIQLSLKFITQVPESSYRLSAGAARSASYRSGWRCKCGAALEWFRDIAPQINLEICSWLVKFSCMDLTV